MSIQLKYKKLKYEIKYLTAKKEEVHNEVKTALPLFEKEFRKLVPEFEKKNEKVVKEKQVLTLMRYYELAKEIDNVHKKS